MSLQSQSAGRVEQEVELLGRKYTLATPPISDVYAGFIERWQRSQPDVLAVAARACESAPPSQHEAIWAAAMKQHGRKPTQAELDAFINSPEGTAYVLWTCLRKHHGEEYETPESVLPIIEGLTEAKLTEVMAKTNIVTGEAESKN